MTHWLLEHFIWIAIALVVIIVGLKYAIAAILKRLMDESAEAARKADQPTCRDERH